MNAIDLEEGSRKIKVGLLDTARLARAFAVQAEELRAAHEKNAVSQAQLDEIQKENAGDKELVDLGKKEMERLYRETEARLRAIALFNRDEEREMKLLASLRDRDLSPRELERWHDRISDEFRLIYPTQPRSLPSDRVRTATQKPDSLGQFRLRG